MRITTLIENRGSEGQNLAFEWGLSLHITHNGRSILLDSGSSGAFADNAERLSVSLAEVDAMVLSHHHFDHGGGLGRFLAINTRAPIYLGPEPDGECHARFLGVFRKYIGLDRSLRSAHPARFSVVREPVEILPGIFVFPCIDRHHPWPAGNNRLFLKKGGRLVPDPFEHELVLAVRESDGLALFTGCSHNGIMNMLATVTGHFPGIPVKAVIGGLHLVASPPFKVMADNRKEVERIGEAILNHPAAMTYTGHCTCAGAFQVLKTVMGERLAEIRTGSVIEV